jgi:methyl-accepting chemotaxis protein
MSQSVEALIQNLKEKVAFAEQIGSGNLEIRLEQIRSEDKLGKALQDMRDSLYKNAEQSSIRNWVTEGLAKFGDVLRQNIDNQEDFYFSIIKNLVTYLRANQGAIFILHHQSDNDKHLLLKAAYAYERKKYLEKKVEIGQGLIGQCFLEGRAIYLKDIPKNYIRITSGLGDAPPSVLLMVPLTLNNESLGVIEIASFKPFKDHEIEFANKVAEAIASSIASFNVANRTKELLATSRQREEEMRSTEEEMRQSMEELESTQEGMKRIQMEMQDSESKMKAVINGTNDSILVFDQSYRIVLINDVLKKRYQGTPYEMDIGDNLLAKLGKDSDVWEEYYRKVFKGEKLEFTIQSRLQKENSRRHYDMIPIYGQEGDVKYCLVITRDEKGIRTDAFENQTDLDQAIRLKAMIVDSHPIVHFDKELNITWMNRVFSEMTGIKGDSGVLPFDQYFDTASSISEIRQNLSKGIFKTKASMICNGKTAQAKLFISPLDENAETYLGLLELDGVG